MFLHIKIIQPPKRGIEILITYSSKGKHIFKSEEKEKIERLDDFEEEQ